MDEVSEINQACYLEIHNTLVKRLKRQGSAACSGQSSACI